jgi:hypothetical protein
MHRAHIGDFKQAFALRIIERSLEVDHALDIIQHAVFSFAIRAILVLDRGAGTPLVNAPNGVREPQNRRVAGACDLEGFRACLA